MFALHAQRVATLMQALHLAAFAVQASTSTKNLTLARTVQRQHFQKKEQAISQAAYHALTPARSQLLVRGTAPPLDQVLKATS